MRKRKHVHCNYRFGLIELESNADPSNVLGHRLGLLLEQALAKCEAEGLVPDEASITLGVHLRAAEDLN